MGRKKDQEQVDAVADLLDMTEEQRFEFGDYIEWCKRHGERSPKKNSRGDFTWDELVEKGQEFLGSVGEE